jgi:hypothetical protein
MFPDVALLPVPIFRSIAASPSVIVPICAWPSGRGRGDCWHRDVVDHPSLIPTAFVVDNEHWGDVSKDINEGARIVGIDR